MSDHVLHRARAVARAVLPCAALVLSACERTAGSVGPEAVPAPAAVHADHGAARSTSTDELAPGVRQALASLRASTARFHDLAAAREAGWATPVTGCLSSPEGGMGFHYADLDRFDTSLDADRPEILVYAPGPQGQLRLVAVEYAVPLAAWTGSEPPSLFGQSFHRNTTFGLWVLHAWVWAPNPKGVFADWNPRIACPGDPS